jgi:hypothetical protein
MTRAAQLTDFGTDQFPMMTGGTVGCEPPVNEMVTKMVTNTGPRADNCVSTTSRFSVPPPLRV